VQSEKGEREMKIKRLVSFLACVAVLGGLFAVSTAALDSGIYTAHVVTSYYNPDTGTVDDGGTANDALGEGMCRSATGETALVEVDGEEIWLTIRLLLQSNCKDIKLATRTGYDHYSAVNYSIMAEDADNDSVDYRIKVSDAGVKMKGSMYVTPMGRDVLWYLYVDTSTLKAGSGDFVVSIDPDEPAQEQQEDPPKEPAKTQPADNKQSENEQPKTAATNNPAPVEQETATITEDDATTEETASTDSDPVETKELVGVETIQQNETTSDEAASDGWHAGTIAAGIITAIVVIGLVVVLVRRKK
jgi:hypothetical protein